MLPGFRFLSVAILLAVSMLIFGLGAAALLRATHEEFASQPLKQMPEVTFGAREETERPTLAVLRIDTPAADSAEPRPDQAEARHPLTASPDAQSESNAAALPATGASSAATDTPSVSTASSSSAPPQVADTAPSPDAATAKSSEPPPGAEASVDAGDAVKPDIAETDAAKSNAIKSNVGASDVAETMTSPLGEHVRPPLPGRRPAQIAQAADPTPRGVKQPSTKPSRLAKQHRHRKVIRRSLPARSAAPNPAPPSASPFALD